MVKKEVKRKKTVKKIPKISDKKTISVEKALIENSVALQRVLTNLSLSMDDLTKKIDKLLDLFEESAKNISRRDVTKENSKATEKEVLEKLENLSEQNKVIARGLTLLHEPSEMPEMEEQEQQEAPQQQGQQPQQMRKNMDMGEYQKSISSKP